MNEPPIVAAYGGGTNSAGLLSGMQERGLRPDLILFSDPGGERRRVYEHIALMSAWCLSVGFPAIITIRKGGIQETLEENCLRMNMLPSIAYGGKSCSQKFKREPQDAYVNQWEPAKAAWDSGLKVVKLLGYDAGEERRAKFTTDAKYDYRYPLIEWGWDREACVQAIELAGLPQPGKSACFFCPSSKREEIDGLRAEEPLLFQRALAMERNAEENLDTIAGLGRYFSWHEHEPTLAANEFALRGKRRMQAARNAAALDPAQESLIEAPCDCYDGETA